MVAFGEKALVSRIGELDGGAEFDDSHKAEIAADNLEMAAEALAAGADETLLDPSALVRKFRKAHHIVEVAVCGMDYDKKLLTGVDGRIYYEPFPNLWADLGDPDSPVVHVGTGKHGGGIMLSPLYVNVEGTWRHALSGEEVSQSTLARLGRS